MEWLVVGRRLRLLPGGGCSVRAVLVRGWTREAYRALRRRARELGKTMAGYIRDLVARDAGGKSDGR